VSRFAESVVEEAALAWLQGLGYAVLHGPDIAAGEPDAERSDPGCRDVVLEGRLRRALARLNPALPPEALEDAFRKLTRLSAPSLLERNRAAHRMLVDGVTVEYRRKDGSIAGDQARLIDIDDPEKNDWLAVNQFTVAEGQHTRRPDVVLFVNGLPLAVIELKNPADENATVWTAWQQLQTYQAQVPALFTTNAALVVSDGVEARIGALGAGKEWFKPWRTITGEGDAPGSLAQLQVVLEGVFEKRRFLDLVRHFVVFEDEGGGKLLKKMAGYHQFHAVNAAVEETLRAAQRIAGDRAAEPEGRYEAGRKPGGEPGDRRVGVVWHTQGSGKSLTMAFYAGRVILHPAMANPTIVVLTDRNDLDDQLFGTFARCRELLRQPPVQAADRADLRKKLAVASGGVVFTTIQKFFPEERSDRHPVLSERRNVVVIADEAHRSQCDFMDGFARHMRDALPNASFVGFTGTPIEKADANTRAVFGDYISVYDSDLRGSPARVPARLSPAGRDAGRVRVLSRDAPGRTGQRGIPRRRQAADADPLLRRRARPWPRHAGDRVLAPHGGQRPRRRRRGVRALDTRGAPRVGGGAVARILRRRSGLIGDMRRLGCCCRGLRE
jgi:type I restriction enzyme R subunit